MLCMYEDHRVLLLMSTKGKCIIPSAPSVLSGQQRLHHDKKVLLDWFVESESVIFQSLHELLETDTVLLQVRTDSYSVR